MSLKYLESNHLIYFALGRYVAEDPQKFSVEPLQIPSYLILNMHTTICLNNAT